MTLGILSLLVCGIFALSGCVSQTEVENSDDGTGPLGRYLDELDLILFPSAEEQEASYREAEELIASCMHEQGFLYFPDVASSEDESKSTEEPVEFGTTDFAREYGFGITVSPWADETIESASLEQNSNYMLQLSTNELEVYRETLYGPPVESEDGVDDAEIVEIPVEQQGCYGRAHAQAKAKRVTDFINDPDYLAMYEAIDAFYVHAEQPKEIGKLDELWRACMTERGLAAYADQGRYEVQAPFDEEHEALVMEFGVELEDLTDPRLKEFMDREFEVAIADAECAEAIEYDGRAAQAFNALEQEFVDAHRDELEALLSRAKAAN